MPHTEKYELVVGLEVHVQLKTESKLFAPDATAFGAEANEQVSYVSAAHPGTLPVLNQSVIEHAVMLGLALNCEINPNSYFDRKNYMYPDLPKGYQITQDNEPICKGGYLELADSPRVVLNRIHIEEDAGKSLHDQHPQYSYIDLNRAGTPLLEVVTEACIHSPEQAYSFLSELRKLVRWLNISDGNMEEGSLRCDANISVREQGSSVLGNKVEIKNMNSIRNAKRAIEHEWKRQVQLLERGDTIISETRGFDAGTGTTFSQRSKEKAHDYRYFPDPDLPPISISEELLKGIAAQMPELPAKRIERYQKEWGLSAYDAQQLTDSKDLAEYYEEVVTYTKHYKQAANWVINQLKSYLNETGVDIADVDLKPKQLADIVELVADGKVNLKSAKEQLFPALLENPRVEVAEMVISLQLLIENDETDAVNLVGEVLNKHPEEHERLKKGNKALIGFFMGELMKASQGKMNPQQLKTLLLEALNK